MIGRLRDYSTCGGGKYVAVKIGVVTVFKVIDFGVNTMSGLDEFGGTARRSRGLGGSKKDHD